MLAPKPNNWLSTPVLSSRKLGKDENPSESLATVIGLNLEKIENSLWIFGSPCALAGFAFLGLTKLNSAFLISFL